MKSTSNTWPFPGFFNSMIGLDSSVWRHPQFSPDPSVAAWGHSVPFLCMCMIQHAVGINWKLSYRQCLFSLCAISLLKWNAKMFPHNRLTHLSSVFSSSAMHQWRGCTTHEMWACGRMECCHTQLSFNVPVQHSCPGNLYNLRTFKDALPDFVIAPVSTQ